MFGKKKKRKQAVSIIMDLVSDHYPPQNFIYPIPEGGSCHIQSYGDVLIITDEGGDMVRHVRSQAGFTVSFTPVYKNDD